MAFKANKTRYKFVLNTKSCMNILEFAYLCKPKLSLRNPRVFFSTAEWKDVVLELSRIRDSWRRINEQRHDIAISNIEVSVCITSSL